ncbi:MAG: DNA polymerase I [Bacteroidia bacterium]|nr:DNA polymerase I [Bacteroidia bacterium]
MSEKKLFLLDGHALVYRAHFAFITRPLINSKGMNTSAITGFVRTLWDIMKNEKPSHIAVAFDPKGDTFRHEYFPEYKANRDATPEDIVLALPYIRDIVDGFDIPVVSIPTFEADDAIGTLAKQAEKEGFKVYMVTPDKDYAQLVSENIFMYKPSRKGNGVDVLGVEEILDQWNISRIEQVIDVLGLQGDSVDNIPGIPGIGPKTAVKLLAEYDTVEGIIEHAEELKGKMKERVIEYADQAMLSKQLATINTEVPCEFDADKYKISVMNKDKLAEIFKDLEFRTLAVQILENGRNSSGGQQTLFKTNATSTGDTNEVRAIAAHSVAEKTINDVEHEYILVDATDAQIALAEKLKTAKVFCFDTETTGIDANAAELVGLAFSTKAHHAYYVPVPEDQAMAQEVVEIFRSVLEDPDVTIIGQNLKYDMLIMKWYGIEINGTLEDTMIYHYLLEPDLRHKLDYLAETYIKYQMVPIESLIGKKGIKQLSMRSVEIDKAKEYAGEDADITLQLKDLLEPKLKENQVDKLYRELEAPLIKVLVDLEFAGVRVDADYLHAYSEELQQLIKEKEKEIYQQAGSDFNIASPRQVGQILFERMKIPYRWKKTKSGQYSTDETKLTELSNDHPIVNDILKFRGYSKLKSTYVDALPKMINPKSGRIHSSFNQALAATGRLSSNNPNLQNIPIRTPEGRRVREAFIPRDQNHILLAADYSQIELRLIAEISNEEAMLDAFVKGQDIHAATASKVYGVPIEEVSSDQRRNAKTVNFSIIYGAGATNLSQQLGIPRKEATALIKAYFAQYNGLKLYMDKVVEEARENGYVSTLLGRRRYLRDINSRNGFIRSNAERLAINSPIQGSAADMIKVAMIDIHHAFQEENLKSKMILQVHDELVFDVYTPELERIKPIIEDKMKNAIPDLKVPILVSMDTGNNWLEAH